MLIFLLFWARILGRESSLFSCGRKPECVFFKTKELKLFVHMYDYWSSKLVMRITKLNRIMVLRNRIKMMKYLWQVYKSSDKICFIF